MFIGIYDILMIYVSSGQTLPAEIWLRCERREVLFLSLFRIHDDYVVLFNISFRDNDGTINDACNFLDQDYFNGGDDFYDIYYGEVDDYFLDWRYARFDIY